MLSVRVVLFRNHALFSFPLLAKRMWKLVDLEGCLVVPIVSANNRCLVSVWRERMCLTCMYMHEVCFLCPMMCTYCDTFKGSARMSDVGGM